jgi:hypothetical protein
MDIIGILEKIVAISRKDLSTRLNDDVWAYQTTVKKHMGMIPYRMVYGKSRHFPIELEHKAY